MTGELLPRRTPAVGRSTERQQLDLFLDGRDALLIEQVVTSLLARDRERARTGLERLRSEHPVHPDLPALAQLVAALDSPPPTAVTPTTLTAGIEVLEGGLAPAAWRLLGEDAEMFLQPSWRALAAAAESLAFDDAHPRAHRSWLCTQYGDWAAVRAAVEAAPGWTARPRLCYRLGLARHHLGEPEAAIRLWLPICWRDPVLFARCAPTIPSPIVRDGWAAFEHAVSRDESLADLTDATSWFPAFLLLRHRGLAHRFDADEVADAGPAARAFRHLLELVPLESRGLTEALVRGRRALQRLSPVFFRHYMGVMGQGRPRA